MMSPTSDDLATRSRRALDDEFLRRAVRFTVERLRDGKAKSTASIQDWEELRERARGIREHVIQHLDYYLARFASELEARGQHVHFAADAQEAASIVLGLVQEKRARLVAKSKSMVSEEVGLNHRLAAEGIECVETDLGEWIVQLAKEPPSHLILPAIHKSRAQVQALFAADGAGAVPPETRALAGYARQRLRDVFSAADVGITGCNFAIAETGSVVIFTNEGNGRMVTTLPRTHIVMMGAERILPTLADLELFVNVLPRSATGQKITTYVNMITGARRDGEADGPEDLHVVVVDNGRSRLVGDRDFEPVLDCIRCGACLNVCPVYRNIGGHAYGSVYSGPIGAVLTPLLLRDEPRARELAQASSLCGACYQACPVKIPLHDMLVTLRQRAAEASDSMSPERLAFGTFGTVVQNPWLYRLTTGLFRALVRYLQRHAAGLLPRLPVISGWVRHRELPLLEGKSFRAEYRKFRKQAEKRG